MYMYCEETSYTSSIYGYYMYQEGSNVHYCEETSYTSSIYGYYIYQ